MSLVSVQLILGDFPPFFFRLLPFTERFDHLVNLPRGWGGLRSKQTCSARGLGKYAQRQHLYVLCKERHPAPDCHKNAGQDPLLLLVVVEVVVIVVVAFYYVLHFCLYFSVKHF